MKKFVKVMALALALVTVCLFAISCSVSGNTYEYEKCEIVGDVDMTESQKTTACAVVDTLIKLSNAKYIFNSDGTLGKDGKSGYWKQSGSKVYSGSSKDFKVEDGVLIGELKGGKFVVSFENDGKSFNLIYKKA